MTNGDVRADVEQSADAEAAGPSLLERVREWFLNEGAWWLSSCVFHMLLICILALIGNRVVTQVLSEAPSFEEARIDKAKDAALEKYELGEAPLEPTELSPETLMLEPPGQIEQTEKHYDDSEKFEEAGGGVAANANQPLLGGLGGFDVNALGAGPAVRGLGGVGVGIGSGHNMGSGGEGIGFGGRGSGSRKAMVGRFGGTKATDRAVAAALNWLARHQNSDGSWGLAEYRRQCVAGDTSCTGPGATHGAEVGATAMGVLPFLAAGQTHVAKGPYRENVRKAIFWLIKNERTDGDLRAGSTMYCHGLATIALCEAYGMTKDSKIGSAAQRAINFIQAAQHPRTGGWRYHPHEEGDTSVLGWQVMALKSGQMAGLSVNPVTLIGAKAFLKTVASGYHDEQFAYMPSHEPSDTMTSVGLLCSQYLGVKRNDPQMVNGAAYLMNNLPGTSTRNVYYWYYATQVMHNILGPQWDSWNRTMRRILIETQVKEGCAAGSWDPSLPTHDEWGDRGGRVMMTSFSALTLEVYYRYLPLYKLDSEDDTKPVAPKETAAATGKDASAFRAQGSDVPTKDTSPAKPKSPANDAPPAEKAEKNDAKAPE